MEIVNKAKEVITNVKYFWKTPPKGRYMPYKEIVSLAGGGIGIKFIITAVQAMSISIGNFLIGNVIGIAPGPMYAIYVLSIIASFPLTGLRANIIDNTQSKKGKYRPYIISMGIPTAILAIGFVWMPYEHMSDLMKCIVVLLFNIGFQFFYMFMYDVYDNFVNVLSPNTQERAEVNSIKAVTDSLAPSIVGIIMPLAAKAITGENTLNDIRIYRLAYPPMIIVGMIMAILVYANTKEKIIQAKTHVIQIKFVDAFRAVAKNKYFWIISLAGWLGFLEGSYGNILNWLYSYQDACSAGMYSLITTVYGNASLWGMIMAPFAIKRFGKKNVLLVTNFLNILFIALLYPSIVSADPKIMIWLVLCCMWMNALVGSFAHILNPSINGDIRDYQQYVTGERIDGMFAAVGLIGSVITLATSGVLPALYSQGGINETKLQELMPWLLESGKIKEISTNVYDVLYNNEIFEKTMFILIGASVIGAVLNVLPYFFYDLTELKQRSIVKVLQIRAMFEDYGNGALADKDIVGTIDLIDEAKELAVMQPQEISKDGIKQAKATKDRQKIKEAKKAYKKAVEYNKEIEISKFIMHEMDRFNTVEGIAQLKAAKEVYDAGLANIANFDKSILTTAKALPKSTPEEKAFRKAEISKAKDTLYAKNIIKKNFMNGIEEFDMSRFDVVFEKQDKNEEALQIMFKKKLEASEKKDNAAVATINENLKALKKEKAQLKNELKKITDAYSLYNRAAKPYVDAKKLLIQAENYKHYDEIAEMYNEAKARAEEEDRQKAAEELRLKKEKAEQAAAIKAQKKSDKAEKKNDKKVNK